MTETKKRVPELRFEGFIDDWEQRKLGEVADISSGGTPDRGKSSYWDGTIPWATTAEVNYSEITNTKEKITIEGLNNSSAKLMPIGTILLAMYGQGKTRGQLGILAIEAATNQANANIQVHRYIYNYFMYYQLVRQYKLLRGLSNEGGQANLSLGIVKNIHVTVINNLDEQIKIGTFFKRLDATIALHQRKLILLQRLKQTYLHGMFPKNNENSPTFRFSSFSNSWEERKFKDFVSKSGKKNTEVHDFPAYSVSNKLGLVKQSDQFDGSRLDDLNKSDYKMVHPEEFAYNPARINVGSLAFNNLEETVVVSSLYVVIKMSKKLDNDYVLQFLKSNRFIKEVKKNTEGSVREYLFFENFKNIKFPYTSNFEEQVTLGSFFKKLDCTIDLHQCKLEKLLELKQILLRKMFL